MSEITKNKQLQVHYLMHALGDNSASNKELLIYVPHMLHIYKTPVPMKAQSLIALSLKHYILTILLCVFGYISFNFYIM